jgi:hypothetical protein
VTTEAVLRGRATARRARRRGIADLRDEIQFLEREGTPKALIQAEMARHRLAQLEAADRDDDRADL